MTANLSCNKSTIICLETKPNSREEVMRNVVETKGPKECFRDFVRQI